MQPASAKRPREGQEDRSAKKVSREEDLSRNVHERITINGSLPRDIFQISTARLKDLYARTDRNGNFAHDAIARILESCTVAFDTTTPTERASSILQPVIDALYTIDMTHASEDDLVEFDCIENILKIAGKVLDLKEEYDIPALSELKFQILPTSC